MANPEHVELVRKGAIAIAEWRRDHPDERLDLSDTDLSDTDLSEANLSWANLSDADLTGANLYRADLTGADLLQTDLRTADLRMANLRTADLSGANPGGANLRWANLSWTDLSDANLSGARLGDTSLDSLNLSGVKGLTDVVHDGPSTIGVDTLVRSYRGAGNRLTPELRTFFLGAGVPPELLDALPGIVGKAEYHSCFISYGQPDLEFATKLYGDLRANGVSCWLYEMDKKVGERTWREIEEKLEEYERMVVLCSIDALLRDGVKKEIDKQTDKNPNKLVPVSLDNKWTHPNFKADWGDRDLKAWLKEKNWADFANKPYEEALEDLLKGLQRPAVKKPRRKKV